MNDKQHILTLLREEFSRWEELLAGLSEEQITAEHSDIGLYCRFSGNCCAHSEMKRYCQCLWAHCHEVK
jgi:hypothetical protein